jgi:hypothetical protein
VDTTTSSCCPSRARTRAWPGSSARCTLPRRGLARFAYVPEVTLPCRPGIIIVPVPAGRRPTRPLLPRPSVSSEQLAGRGAGHFDWGRYVQPDWMQKFNRFSTISSSPPSGFWSLFKPCSGDKDSVRSGPGRCCQATSLVASLLCLRCYMGEKKHPHNLRIMKIILFHGKEKSSCKLFSYWIHANSLSFLFVGSCRVRDSLLFSLLSMCKEHFGPHVEKHVPKNKEKHLLLVDHNGPKGILGSSSEPNLPLSSAKTHLPKSDQARPEKFFRAPSFPCPLSQPTPEKFYRRPRGAHKVAHASSACAFLPMRRAKRGQHNSDLAQPRPKIGFSGAFGL